MNLNCYNKIFIYTFLLINKEKVRKYTLFFAFAKVKAIKLTLVVQEIGRLVLTQRYV